MASTEPAHHYHFDITMTCGGCSGAVERVLKKTEGRALSPFLTPLPPSLVALAYSMFPAYAPFLPSSPSVRSSHLTIIAHEAHRPRLLRRQPRGPDRGRLHRRRPLCRRAREDQEDGQDGQGGRGGRGGDGCLNRGWGKQGRWGWVWVGGEGSVWFYERNGYLSAVYMVERGRVARSRGFMPLRRIEVRCSSDGTVWWA